MNNGAISPLKKRIIERKISHKVFSQASGVGYDCLLRVLGGASMPNEKTCDKIDKALNLDSGTTHTEMAKWFKEQQRLAMLQLNR